MSFLLIPIALSGFTTEKRPWMEISDPPSVRASKLVAAMTFKEQTDLFHGSCGGYTGSVCGNTRLGIPQLKLNDGPQGFRGRPSTSTAFPAAITAAATFDPALAKEWGAAMGREFYLKGANVQLGPGLCIARIPRNGRNFEYVSGEDPLLGYRMAAAVVQGIQSEGVVATAKHWVQNNQETDRHYISENVDERTQFEIYYPPFEGAIRAGLGSIMCSYNRIGKGLPLGWVGNWSCENDETLRTDLKERLNFTGWVMSDWTATHSTSISQGLDQEMPGGRFMNNASIGAMVDAGKLSREAVAESAHRILWPLFAVGAFDTPSNGTADADVRTATAAKVARRVASAGMVLLQNTNKLLPLGKSVKSLAIIGSQAASPIYGGGGSGAVATSAVSSPLEALRARSLGLLRSRTPGAFTFNLSGASDVILTGGATIYSEGIKGHLCLRSGGVAAGQTTHSAAMLDLVLTPGAEIDALEFAYSYETGYSGVKGAAFNISIAGTVAYASPVLNDYPYSKHGAYSPVVSVSKRMLGIVVPETESAARVIINFTNYDRNLQLLLPLQLKLYCSTAACAVPPAFTINYADGRDVSAAAAAAAAADAALVFVGTDSTEGTDRGSLSIGAGDVLISAVAAAAGAKTAVIAVSPGAILTDWRPNVSSIVAAFLPGQEFGLAVTSLLFGDESPSGRLPVTFPAMENETAFSPEQWPGVHSEKGVPINGSVCTSWRDNGGCTSIYSERLNVGYRWYNSNPAVIPAFPFGHGLTYSEFNYASLAISRAAINFTLSNIGNVKAAETAQLYLDYPPEAGEPQHQLRGFEKITLAPRESALASFVLSDRSFSVWDAKHHKWTVVRGVYVVSVGTSVGDIRLKGSLRVS